MLARIAEFGFGEGAARLESVVLADETAGAVAQHLLFF